MTRNMGTADRIIRLIAGIGILGLYGALATPWNDLALIGLVPLGTALTGNCPIYSWLGINTLGRKPAG
jgi:Protein of unknown function (DUF2892)